MFITVKLRYLRIAPRKVRLAADLVRGKNVEQARTILNFALKRASHPLLKLLDSAIAGAKNNFRLDESNLYVFKIAVDEGPKNKRWRAQSRGRAAEIQKKSSHITIVLGEIEEKKKKKSAKIETKIKPVEKEEKTEKTEKKAEKPKIKFQKIIKKPKINKSLKKIFRRKAF